MCLAMFALIPHLVFILVSKKQLELIPGFSPDGDGELVPRLN